MDINIPEDANPMDIAEAALDLDDAYTEALPPQLRFVCTGCGRPPMKAAQRLRAERSRD